MGGVDRCERSRSDCTSVGALLASIFTDALYIRSGCDAQVRCHEWFCDLSFAELEAKLMPAPLIPAVEGDDDTEQASILLEIAWR